MATYKVVDADQLNADMTSVADSIRTKGGTTEALAWPDGYKTAIEAIQTGGGGGGGSSGDPLDPVEVYNNTRPSDWLSMPTPADNEMYLLFHIPNGVSSLLAFTVTCTGNYTVALGTVSGGSFVASSSVDIASGSKYEAELFADDYGDLTSDGMKQVMVKVSGTDILTWKPSTHSKKTSPSNFAVWNIVEISCNFPSGTSVKCGNSSEYLALTKLRYFTWYGKNAVTSMANMFNFCRSLTSIPHMDTHLVTDMNSMFSGCSSLTAIPQLYASLVTNMSYMFSSCRSLTSIPHMDTHLVTDMQNMFYSCYSLTAIPHMDTSAVTNMNSMFYYCSSLKEIPQLNTSLVTSMKSMFGYCSSLKEIPQLNTSLVTSMENMFERCYSLTAIPHMDTHLVTDMYSMFSGCSSLTAIPQLNTSAVRSINYTFNYCYSLTAITLDNTVTGWSGYAISLSNCSLGHTAIVAFFYSLPTITSAKAITLTGNPGVSELTDTEKAIATGKGWTLTL